MKKLLNTLYVTSDDSYLSLDGENIVVLDKEREIGRLHQLVFFRVFNAVRKFCEQGKLFLAHGFQAWIFFPVCIHTVMYPFLNKM